MVNDKPKTQEYVKCIHCAYAVWPNSAPGFCMIHQIEPITAREKSGPCGPDGLSFMALQVFQKV